MFFLNLLDYQYETRTSSYCSFWVPGLQMLLVVASCSDVTQTGRLSFVPSPTLETWCDWIEYVFNKPISQWINKKLNPSLVKRPAWVPAASEAIRRSRSDLSEAGTSILCMKWRAACGTFCVKSLFPLKVGRLVSLSEPFMLSPLHKHEVLGSPVKLISMNHACMICSIMWHMRSWESWKLKVAGGSLFPNRLLLFTCKSARKLKNHCCFTFLCEMREWPLFCCQRT